MIGCEVVGYTGQTPAMLSASLQQQIGYLEKSARDYDSGDASEGPRMATALRVLFHDTNSSHSLMKQIGLKENLKFVDTSISNTTVFVNRPNIRMEVEYEDGRTGFVSMGQDGLVDIFMDGTDSYYVASIKHVPERSYRLKFNNWWNDEIMDIPVGHRYSRKRLVLAMTNTGGGAHIDPRGVAIEYQNFTLNGFIAWTNELPIANMTAHKMMMNDSGVPLRGDAATPSVRQMVFEALETFKESTELQKFLSIHH